MSLFADKTDDFVGFLEKDVPISQEPSDYHFHASYVHRSRFAEYLHTRLDEAIDVKDPRIEYDRRIAAVKALQRYGPKWQIQLDDGAVLTADKVLLAVGNLPPKHVDGLRAGDESHPRYAANPWAGDVLDDLKPDDPVLLVGSGLTMVDIAINLKLKEHLGTIYTLSRHGFLPQTHESYQPYRIDESRYLNCHTMLQLLRLFRSDLKQAATIGADWRGVLEGLRPIVPAIWQQLPIVEKKQFLIHLRPLWEAHRHRMPGFSALRIHNLLQSGQLELLKGRIKDIDFSARRATVHYQPRNAKRLTSITVARIINCTGPRADYRVLDHPLLNQLVGTGYASTDPLNMGLLTDANGQLINQFGQAEPGLFTIGPVRRGTLWESTACREIRLQAEALVHHLAEQDGLMHSEETALEANGW